MTAEENIRQGLGSLIGAGYLTGTRQSGKTLAVSQAIERDTAHAVALEREAIAKWLDEVATTHDTPTPEATVISSAGLIAHLFRMAALDIRGGAHNQPTEEST